MLIEKIINMVDECGFDEHMEIETKDIIFTDDVIGQCLKCPNSGKNYACPPFSGDLEANKSRVLKYSNAMIVNKIMAMPDTREGWENQMKESRARISRLRKELKELPVEVRTGGGCDLCPKCAVLTNEPCRHPEQIRYSMEGSGMDICAMALKLGMTYNAGERGLGYFYMILY
ncbi:hypothetical protein OXPF_32820 [Oxobacter pfennigii]|uniref:DUF2284 domain-containing protein n=1 Tax=Oxobacter pfennigii TaxID=36849 RepID=A0A0P8WY23_9CLOT|nr:DUF2284 domain-containing protein [Oxobacter pfennigii]KPU43268.1 hypothetical protein OXPF_32820 [Oxobacter pfennigii]